MRNFQFRCYETESFVNIKNVVFESRAKFLKFCGHAKILRIFAVENQRFSNIKNVVFESRAKFLEFLRLKLSDFQTCKKLSKPYGF
jgi:uncharacterized Fe-S cluster-containing MiaB family protein